MFVKCPILIEHKVRKPLLTPALALDVQIGRVVATVADADVAERVHQASEFRAFGNEAAQKTRILAGVRGGVVLPILPQRGAVHERAAAYTLGKEESVQPISALPQAHITNIEQMRHAKGGNLGLPCQNRRNLLREALWPVVVVIVLGTDDFPCCERTSNIALHTNSAAF